MNQLAKLLAKPFPLPVLRGGFRLNGKGLAEFRTETATRAVGSSIAAVEQFEQALQSGDDPFPSFDAACTVLYFNLNRLEAVTGIPNQRARKAFDDLYKDSLESHNRLKEGVAGLAQPDQESANIRLAHLSQYIENALASQAPKNKSNEPTL